ncbi:MAG: hypothetical protein GC159_06710 [Phycisphaera sp.]|nr:hypothetical protein [Phycisphaera sp.]
MHSSRKISVRDWLTRLAILGIVSFMVIGAEQVTLQWTYPTTLSELAVQQLEASNDVAEAMRIQSDLRHTLTMVCESLVVAVALVLFTGPVVALFQRRTSDEGAGDRDDDADAAALRRARGA